MSLDEIRAEIDRIDAAMLALLGQRMAAIEAVRLAKAGEPGCPVTAMRPDREAAIIRRLVGARTRHVPAPLVERVWREIIASATHLQVPYRVHLCAGEAALDLVHAHFGAATPVISHPSLEAAVSAVTGRGADVAVVPAACDREDWVSVVLAAGSGRPRVVARVPFVDAGERQAALVLGHAPVEGSSDDTTVIALKIGDGATMGETAAALKAIGSSGRWRLAGADGLVSRDSRLMTALTDDPAVAAAEILGAFANPVRLTERV